MATPRHRRTVVIVEDSEAIAEIIRATLEAEPDYRAVVIHDGRAALDAIRGIQADVVLLDVGLPGLSGPDLYEALRADPKTRYVPVLFVTANYDSPEFARLGITNFLAKPFNLDDLLAQVEAACHVEKAPQPSHASSESTAVLDGRLYNPKEIINYLTLSE